MWVFTKNGFFSAVEHFEKPNTVHVRARFEGDLERLCKAHNIEPQIDYTPNNDYAYRMDFDKSQWAQIIAQECEEIDYHNFKNEVHDGTARDRAYMECWYALNKAQH